MNIELLKTQGKSLLREVKQGSEDYRLERIPEIGARRCYSDGSEYVFCSTAVTLNAGYVVAAPPAYHLLTNGPSETYNKGVREVEIESTKLSSIEEAQLAGGHLLVTNTVAPTSGPKVTYKIQMNNKASGNKVKLYLYEGLCSSLNTNDEVDIVPPRYENVVLAGIYSDPIGVLTVKLEGTSSKKSFGWVQCKGVANVIVPDTVSINSNVSLVLAASGEVAEASANTISPSYGRFLSANNSTGVNPPATNSGFPAWVSFE